MSYDLTSLRNQVARLYLEALSLLRDLAMLLEPGDEVRREIGRIFHEKGELLMVTRDQLINSILVYIARVQPLGPSLVEASNLLYLTYDVYRFARYAREIYIADVKGVSLSTPRLKSIVEPALRIAVEAAENAYRVYFEDCTTCIDSLRRLGEESDKLYLNQLEKISSTPLVENTDAVALLVLRHVERIVDHAEGIALMKTRIARR